MNAEQRLEKARKRIVKAQAAWKRLSPRQKLVGAKKLAKQTKNRRCSFGMRKIKKAVKELLKKVEANNDYS